MTSSCSYKRCRKYSNFERFLRLPKRIILKNMIFVFLLWHRYKPHYNSRINNWLKTYNHLCNKHFKNWKKGFFSWLLLKSIINWYMQMITKGTMAINIWTKSIIYKVYQELWIVTNKQKMQWGRGYFWSENKILTKTLLLI